MSRVKVNNYKFDESIDSILVACRCHENQKLDLKIFLRSIEEFCRDYRIPEAIIPLSKIKDLLPKEEFPRGTQILNLFDNLTQVQKGYVLSRTKYSGDQGKVAAIIKAQSVIRMYLQREKYHKMQLQNHKSADIQRWWKGCLRLRETRSRIKQNNLDIIQRFRETQDTFARQWDVLRFHKRVEVHISSWTGDEMQRVRTERLKQRENTQVSRIFRTTDPNITVIYVSPIGFSAELISYFSKMLSLHEEAKTQRVFFVSPEVTLSPSMTLVESLCHSPKCLKRIRDLISNKSAYIVPG